MQKLQRTLERWAAGNPKVMYEEGSKAALFYALADAQKDIQLLGSLLCVAAYPRRGTVEESLTMEQFAALVQRVISLSDAANGTIRVEV